MCIWQLRAAVHLCVLIIWLKVTLLTQSQRYQHILGIFNCNNFMKNCCFEWKTSQKKILGTNLWSTTVCTRIDMSLKCLKRYVTLFIACFLDQFVNVHTYHQFTVSIAFLPLLIDKKYVNWQILLFSIITQKHIRYVTKFLSFIMNDRFTWKRFMFNCLLHQWFWKKISKSSMSFSQQNLEI
jgi:hypothetical protein